MRPPPHAAPLARAPEKRLRWARFGCAALLGVTALNHAVQVALGAGNASRHAWFVGINCALALLLIARPRWAIVPTALLAVQQAASHGTALVSSTRDPASSFDWASLGVLVFFPALLALLVVERRTLRHRS